MAGDLLWPIPPGWTWSTLGEACTAGGGNVQTGPFGSQLHASDYVASGIPSIMPQNIGDNRVVEQGIARIAPADAERLSRHLVKAGDIICSRRGDVERRALIRDKEAGWLCGTGCLRVRFGKGLVDPLYASYYLGHPRVREWIVRHAHGATMANLNTAILSALPLAIPPVSDQRAIAHILGALDDKIELNRRTNETLEAIARALFKSWFVDFDPVRAKAAGLGTPSTSSAPASAELVLGVPSPILDLFPDHFEESDLGEIPAGWDVTRLGDEFNLTMGQSPPGETYNQDGEGLPFFQGRADFGFRYPSRRVYCTAPTRFANPGDTLVSVRAPVGDINMAIEPCSIGRGVAAILHKSGSRSYTFYAMHSLSEAFANFEAEGTVFGSISKGDFRRMKIVAPPRELVREFERVCFPFDQAIENHEVQSGTLVATRDSLLPRLLSGRLRVKDVERFLEKSL